MELFIIAFLILFFIVMTLFFLYKIIDILDHWYFK
mgnify:CR=1 FL=1